MTKAQSTNTSSATTIGNFGYRSDGWKQAVNINPTINLNPISQLIDRYTAEYAIKFSDPKPPKDQVLGWIRKDPQKVAVAKAQTADFKKVMAASLRVVECPVHDGRSPEVSQEVSLETTGFDFQRHDSKVDDWDNDKQVREVYYPEIAQYVQNLTGATFAFCNDHSLRSTKDAAIKTEGENKNFVEAQGANGGLTNGDVFGLSMKNPVPIVHNDFAQDYDEYLAYALDSNDPDHDHAVARLATYGLLGQLKAAGITGADLAGPNAKYRVMVVNAWRNCSDYALETMPLAVCDRRTVAMSGELVDHTNLVSGGTSSQPYRTLKTRSSEYTTEHKWYWYPAMRNDEVLLFKTYDTGADEVPLHCAFQPKGSTPVLGRHSCETRVLCLMPKTPSVNK